MKYVLLAIVIGILRTGSLTLNGELSGAVGNYPATVIIHIVGLITLLPILLFRKKSLHPGAVMPWYLYLGGAVGVGSVLLVNYGYAALGASVVMALGLLGQLCGSILIDQFGLFGLPKSPIRRHRLMSCMVVLIGIALMIGGG